MDYIILIGVITVIGLFALLGYSKGMVRIVLSMIAMTATYILAAALTIPVSMAIKSATPIYSGIEESVDKMVEDANIGEVKVDVTVIEKLDLPLQIEEKLVEGAEKVTTGFNDYLVKSISNLILKALTFFILFIVIYIILSIVIGIFDFVSKLPLLNTVNKAAGLAVGAAQGLLIVWIGCLVITAFGDKTWAQEAFRQINSNALLTFIYENNPIIFLVTKFM